MGSLWPQRSIRPRGASFPPASVQQPWCFSHSCIPSLPWACAGQTSRDFGCHPAVSGFLPPVLLFQMTIYDNW